MSEGNIFRRSTADQYIRGRRENFICARRRAYLIFARACRGGPRLVLALCQGEELTETNLLLVHGQRLIVGHIVGSGRLLRSLRKRAGKIGYRRETLLRLLSQRAQQHHIESLWQARVKLAGRGRLNREMLIHQLLHASRERRAPGQQFVSHDRQRILVAREYRVAAPLFGRHRGRRASNRAAGTGNRRKIARNAKIGEEQRWTLRIPAVAAQEKVRGLHIQVNNPVIMGILKRLSRLLNQVGYLLRREKPLTLPTLPAL